MKKKSVMLAVVLVLAMCLAVPAMAAPWGGGPGGGMGPGYGGGPGYGPGPAWQGQAPPQLTDEQKAAWNAWYEKNLQLRKEYIQNLVSSGVLTQEQADARIKLMEESYNFRVKNGWANPWGGIASGTQLTDEQKADLRKLFEQRLALRKEILDSYVKAGQITQAQADSQLAWMRDRFELRLKYGFAGPMGGGFGGRGMGGGRGFGGGMMGPRF